MGVLEDAIREHLELKRQHGASEEEVVRQETEVLGHARQAAPAEGEDELASAEAAEPAPEGHSTEESPVAEEPVAEVAEEPAAVPYEEPVADPYEEPVADSYDAPAPDPARDDTRLLEDPLEFDEIEPGVAPPMPAQEDPRPPEPEAAAEGAPEDEDVLEETPEFLQETPEHDRLWFEQKPPRDFDFD